MKNILTADMVSRRWSPQTNRAATRVLPGGFGSPDEYFPVNSDSPCACLNGRLKPVTVLLAESRTIVRQGISALLAHEKGIKVTGEAQDGREAIALAQKLRPDTVILCGNLAFRNRLELARHILHVVPAARIILLVREGEDTYAKDAASLGVAGYLTEQVSGPKLAGAVRATQQGGQVFLPVSVKPPEESLPGSKPEVELTSRQKQILRLIAEGNANKQTASDLSISIKTVEKHRQGLMTKLGIHETAGLTRYAIAAGLVTCDPCAKLPLPDAFACNSSSSETWLASSCQTRQLTPTASFKKTRVRF